MNHDHSRREFLALVAGVMAAPMALSGCSRRSSSAQDASAADDANLDDIEEAATFRPPLPSAEPIIRVRVMKIRGANRENDTLSSAGIQIGADDQWIRLRREHGPMGGIAVCGPLLVMMEPIGWSIVDGKGFRATVDGRESIELTALEDWPSAMLSVREMPAAAAASSSTPSPIRQYPGTLRLVSRHDLGTADGASATVPRDVQSSAQPSSTSLGFDLINDVVVESYLPGVLAGELYKNWQFETFAAQAVAARSFACTEAAVFSGRRHYDVSNNTTSQMYLGGVALRQAQDAVSTTRGLMLAYDNLLVSGYYSSCCGGAAASAVDAIGPNPVNDAVPLQGRTGPDVCTSAPVYQWKVEHPIDLLSRRLVNFGSDRKIKELMSLSRVAGIEIVATNANSRPTRIRVTDDRRNAAELTAENFRRAANMGGAGHAPPPPEKPLRSSNFKATFARDVVRFEGFGLGHGVGLCQYGAEAQARDGKMHEGILRWYYPGVELVRAYG